MQQITQKGIFYNLLDPFLEFQENPFLLDFAKQGKLSQVYIEILSYQKYHLDLVSQNTLSN